MWVLMIFLLTPVYKVLSVKDSVVTRVVRQRITANYCLIFYAKEIDFFNFLLYNLNDLGFNSFLRRETGG